jgi:hypothetical protein
LVDVPRASLRKVSRLAGVVLAIVIALAVVLLLGTPLVLRGERFAWALARLVPATQGTIKVGGGALGWSSLAAVLLGRPAHVQLRDVLILDPEGVEVFAAARVSAAVQVERNPWRVAVHDLRPGAARWRMARMRERRGIGFLAAFLPPRRPGAPGRRGPRAPAGDAGAPGPAGDTRRGPSGGTRAPAARAEGTDFTFTITGAELDGLDASFDFPGWGLVLNDVRARGQLVAGISGGRPVLRFEAAGVDARGGGLLRILGGRALTAVPFDRVLIDRVGVPADAPSDLLLLVREAATGRSRLGGRALFAGLFGQRGQRGPGQGGRAPGMEIDADWRQAGDALTEVARSRGVADLTVSGADARLRATVSSGFNDLDGRFVASGLDVEHRGQRVLDAGLELAARGPPFTVKADPFSFRSPAGGRVEGSASFSAPGDARLRVRLAALATLPLLPEPLQPTLGGIASGHVAARVDLAARRAVLESMDVTLQRHRRGPLPRRLRLHTGPPAPASIAARTGAPGGDAAARTGASGGGPAEETLVASLRSLRWEDGRLVNRGVVAQAFGGRVEADATLVLRGPSRPGAPPAAGELPRMDVRVAASGIDLRRAFSSGRVAGVVGFKLAASGPLARMDARLEIPPGTTVRVLGQPYGLPARVRASVRGDEAVLAPFQLAAPGGGTVSVEGRMVLDRMLDLRLAVDRHPLEALPVLSQALPALRGRFGGRLVLRGEPRAPTLAGELRLTGVALRDVALGDGRLQLRPAGAGRTTLEGRLFDRITVYGHLLVAPAGPEIDATVDVDHLRLDPFLSVVPALAGARLRVGGRFTLAMRRDAPLALAAELPRLTFAWGCGPDASARPRPGCVDIENVGPVRLTATGGTAHLELRRSRFRTRDGDSTLELGARLDEGALDARAEGRLDGKLLAPLLRRLPVTVAGSVDAALVARGPVQAPVVTGRLRVVRPLQVAARDGRLSAQVSGGEITLERSRLASDGITVEAPGVRLALAGSLPLSLPLPGARGAVAGELGPAGEQPIALRITGELGAEALARLLPEEISAARGALRVDARVDGTLAHPRFGGQAQLASGAPVSLRLRYRDTRVELRGGRLLAEGQRLRIDGLEAELSPGGRVVVGPPGRPATVEVLSLWPLTLGRIDVSAAGERLDVESPWLSLRDGRLAARLHGHGTDGPLVLTGDVALKAGRFRPRRQPPKGDRASARIARRLPRPVRSAVFPLQLDLRIRSDGRAFVVDPGWLPDLHLGLDVHVGGTSDRPRVAWQADPHGVYSNLAMFIYRLL